MFDKDMFEDDDFLKKTIDTLMITQAKDRLLLFSLMQIVIGYINDPEQEKDYIDSQNELLYTISQRFDIQSNEDLNRSIDWVSDYLKNAQLAVIEPLQGLH